MTNILSFLTFLTVVISISILMIRYFIHSMMGGSRRMVKYRRELMLLYIPIFLSFFLFSNRSLQGSLSLSIFSCVLYAFFTFMFVFFLYGLFVELLILIRKLFKNIYSKKLPLHKKRLVFIVLFLISFHTVATGFFLAEDIQVVTLKIKNPKIEKYTRIVQVTDIHFSATTGLPFAQKIASIITELNPDILISTGDYLDHGMMEPERIAEAMNSIPAPLGKFAITGNHEFINDFNNSKNFLEKNGFKLIDNQIIDVWRNITISAVADKTGKRFGMSAPNDLDILKKAHHSRFNIFLKHQPKIEKGATDRFDLMLSGHTHAGQIFPFGIFVRMAFKYCSGNYKFNSGSILHVSRGTGTWGPPVRFGSMPEITLIELIP
ncbi:MAG TPA: metallophosphoesterase [bacterium]|nr:metallophosphoesterase [bacterium]